MNEIQTLYREGVSVSAISSLTGFDRKTIRKYLHAGGIPRYGPREPRPSKLHAFKQYLDASSDANRLPNPIQSARGIRLKVRGDSDRIR